MIATLVVLIVSVAIFVVLLVVIVVVGIRQEPPTEELSERTSRLIAAFVRRLLGLHVRKPGSHPTLTRDERAMPRARDHVPRPNVHAQSKNEGWMTLPDARARHIIRIESELLGPIRRNPDAGGG
jgi:hypothetical protein